jgi:hypothetical protein
VADNLYIAHQSKRYGLKCYNRKSAIVNRQLIVGRKRSMATLTIELSDEILAQLHHKATQDGKTTELLVQEWVTNQAEAIKEESLSAREIGRRALKAAGILAEIDPELVKMGDPTVSLEEVRQALSGGRPLSEIAIEQRGPLY